jgi:SsrA-binding protein
MATKRKKKPDSKAEASKGPFIKTVADNRRARFDYDVIERIEAGLVLGGTEIKSVRAGKTTIRDGYAQVRNGEMWLQNVHIAPWTSGGPWNHEPVHPRRVLMHKDQIERWGRLAGSQGLTIVPMRLYIKGHYAKVELALVKGRKRYDKRKAIQQRETDREIARALRQAV